jgi:hypothetical protein
MGYAFSVDEGFAKRAEYRRKHWKSGVARSHAEMEEIDLDFWAAATVQLRFDTMWKMLFEHWDMKGRNGPPPGLRRSVGGTRPVRR